MNNIPPHRQSPEDTNRKIADILKLKKDYDACILVHNYQRPELYEVADLIGDSLELALAARRCGRKTIVFCGVDFMAETAKILNPEATILHPEPDAQCPMAHMVQADEIERMKKTYPDAEVVCYVNTTAETKALSDICCTSANAVDIVRACTSDTVIFLPDLNLASYVQRFTTRRIIPGRGNCYVHDRITPLMVSNMKAFHPNSPVVVHPECRPEVIDVADAVCSTSSMVGYCKDNSAVSFIIGTEHGMINRLKREIPDKKFYPVGGICSPMKMITLDSVISALSDGKGEVLLDADLITAARRPLERMMNTYGRQKNVPCGTLTRSGLGISSVR